MKSSDYPRISVVTPSFNQGKYIEDTILSVIDQDYPNYEFFICDAGSKDETVEVIKKYEKHITWWCSEKDKGHTDAINKGLRRSTGQILCYMNSDDFFLRNAFHYVAQAYMAHPQAGLFTGNGLLVDGQKLNPRPYMNQIGFSFETMLKGSCYLLQPSSFVTRKAWDKVGEFDDSLKFAMDLDYWLRVASEFETVVMNEPLSAWRIHEDIKTPQGAFVRWTELWRIYRKHTKDQITPGLLVEFFNILKYPLISEQLGFDVKPLAEQAFWHCYNEMQRVLGTQDCIPVGKGTYFRPTPPRSSKPFRAYPCNTGVVTPPPAPVREIEAPAIISQRGSAPRIDLVLQATGNHAWAVGGGWENAARKLGVHHRTFHPHANWGDADVRTDDGLFEYLTNPQADIILLAGFDWHSQMLHGSKRWVDRWQQCPALKVLYSQESIVNHAALSGNTQMEDCLRRAARCADAIVYTDISDFRLMESTGKPAWFQPFGVDDTVFKAETPFAARLPRAFFRGKYQAFAGQSTSYQDRRVLIQYLLERGELELLPYLDRPITPKDLAADFNRFQIAVNFPSVFSNHPTRVYEAMACGCAVVTNRTGNEKIDRQFTHDKHLLYYTNRDELGHCVRRLMTDPVLTERLAIMGRDHVLENYALHRLLTQIIDWTGSVSRPVSVPPVVVSTPAAPVPTVASVTAAPAGPSRPASPGEKTILIDGVIFYLQQGRPLGISRVWQSLLTELAASNVGPRIVLLDRNNTAPAIQGIRRVPFAPYDFRRFEADSLLLQRACEETNAAFLISTYHTYAETAPTVVMLHDMIPEVMGQDLNQPEWRAKARSLEKACAYFAVSQSTINDFRKLYPQFAERPVHLVPNAVSNAFHSRTEEEVRSFKKNHGIEKPYFLLVGHRMLYKNASLFFRAFSLLRNKEQYEILCTGGAENLESALTQFVAGSKCQVKFLSDDELSVAYAGAAALVYPSNYEGFGLPILEAQSSRCPVITCRNSSIPEVGDDAVLYVGGNDVAGMVDALQRVRDPKTRRDLVERGAANAARFSWRNSAGLLEIGLQDLLRKTLPVGRPDCLNTIERLAMHFRQKNQAHIATDLIAYSGMVLARGRHDLHMLEWIEDRLMPNLARVCSEIVRLVGPLSGAETLVAFIVGLAQEGCREQRLAIHAYLRAIDCIQPDHVIEFRIRLGLRMARIAFDLGDPKTCEQIISSVVLPHSGKLPEALTLVNEARKAMGQQPILAAAVLPDPRRVAELIDKAQGSLQRGDLENAINGFRQAVAAAPNLAEAHYHLGRALFKQGDPGGACVELEHAVRIQADHVPSLLLLARAAVQMGHILAFEESLGRVLKLQPGNPAAIKLQAEVNCQANRLQEATAACLKLLEKDGSDIEALTIVAACFVKAGEVEAARDTFQRILDIDPSNRIARERMEALPVPFRSAPLPSSEQSPRVGMPQQTQPPMPPPAPAAPATAPAIPQPSPSFVPRFSADDDEDEMPMPGVPAAVANAKFAPAPVPPPSSAPDAPPLVSAIVSTYKSERFMRGCLEDLTAQTLFEKGLLEIVVVDSASPENERAIVEEFQKRHGAARIVYLRTPERESLYAAWNTGIKAAHGRYITNANTDDRHRADALEILARTLDEHPDVTLVYADSLITQTENETFAAAHVTGRFRWLDFSREDLLLKGCYVGPQPMWRREVHEEHGWFDGAMVASGDYDFWLRIARTRKLLHVPEFLGLYLDSPASVEHSNQTAGRREVAEVRRRYARDIIPGCEVRDKDNGDDVVILLPETAASRPIQPRKPGAIELPPCARLGHLAQARELFKTKKSREAWTSTLAAIGVRPFHPEAFLLLAEIAQAAGSGAFARQLAQYCRDIAPGFKPVKQLLKGKLHGNSKPDWMALPDHLRNPQSRPRLSVCLIVKNEEQYLPACLKSVRDLASQIVVVDTGSTDRTVDIAKEFGAEVHSFEWCDDFSLARNAALEHATGDWILVLDADEELDAGSRDAILKHMGVAGVMAWRLPIFDVGIDEEGCSYVPRLFRNAPGLFYVGRVHEQVFSSIEVRRAEWGLDNRIGEAKLLHHGYRPEVTRDRNKIQRNLKLLEIAIQEMTGEPHLIMQYALELSRSGLQGEALGRYREAFDLLSTRPSGEVVPELRETLLTQFSSRLMSARQFDDIVRVLTSPLARMQNGLGASLHFTLGLAFMELKRNAEAVEQFRQCIAKRDQISLVPINKEVRKAGPRHCMAVCLDRMGDTQGAAAAFEAALKEDPQSFAVRFDHAGFIAARGRQVEALQTLHQLVQERPAEPGLWIRGAEIALGHPQLLEVALDWTAAAIGACPGHVRIKALRAEALTLGDKPLEAMPLWRELPSAPALARNVAALILCETLAGQNTCRPGPDGEMAVSGELLKWYQQLLRWKAVDSTSRLNGKLAQLSVVLPSAAQAITVALSEG
jgi:glycosyltransferase involved in cell wall biosynthesis/Tfp pilus assembly protein PilF